MSNIQRGLSLKVGAGGGWSVEADLRLLRPLVSRKKPVPEDATPRPSMTRTREPQAQEPCASRIGSRSPASGPKHRSTILHTDSARSYRTKIHGVLHDAVVHQKKKVLRGGKKFGSPPPSFAWQNNGCKITVKAGTQEIGRAWALPERAGKDQSKHQDRIPPADREDQGRTI